MPTLRDSSSDELLAVRGERVGERVQEAGALVRGRLAPVAVERGARRLDRAVDLGLAGELRGPERLAGRRLDEIAGGRALDRLAVDEEPVLVRRDGHGRDDSATRRMAEADGERGRLDRRRAAGVAIPNERERRARSAPTGRASSATRTPATRRRAPARCDPAAAAAPVRARARAPAIGVELEHARVPRRDGLAERVVPSLCDVRVDQRPAGRHVRRPCGRRSSSLQPRARLLAARTSSDHEHCRAPRRPAEDQRRGVLTARTAPPGPGRRRRTSSRRRSGRRAAAARAAA